MLPPGRRRQELALSLLFSIYPNAIHKIAGKLCGDYTFRTEVFSPSRHKPPPAAQQQQCEHRASGGPAVHSGWDFVQVMLCVKPFTGQTLTCPFEHHAQGCGDGSPSSSSIAQGMPSSLSLLCVQFPPLSFTRASVLSTRSRTELQLMNEPRCSFRLPLSVCH